VREIGILTADKEKVVRDLDRLMDCFRDVLTEGGQPDVAAALPWQNDGGDGTPVVAPKLLAQASSIAFVLLTLVEHNATAAYRRRAESREGLTSVRSLWAATLQELQDRGLDPDAMARELGDVAVEIVLTAHPTEAKRATVLEHHRELYRLLARSDRPGLTPAERAAVEDGIRSWLTLLWRTGEIFLEKPDVASERRNVIHYLDHIFPRAVTDVDLRLRHAWTDAGFGPDRLDDPARLPVIRIGTWVGGDRDGHPLVTADLTRESLLELRTHALRRLRTELTDLARRLSLSDLLQSPPDSLRDRVTNLAQRLGDAGRAAVERNPDETWRQMASLMAACLPMEPHVPPAHRLDDDDPRYRQAHELMDDLRLLDASLREVGADRIARHAVEPVARRLRSFGFHAAVLDVRQNSAFHDRALAQILDDAAFGEHDEPTRRRILDQVLEDAGPAGTAADPVAQPEAHAVLASYRVLADHRDRYGDEGLGALIVSMTRDVSDLLAVHVLRPAGRPRDRDRRRPWRARCPWCPCSRPSTTWTGAPRVLGEYLHPAARSDAPCACRPRAASRCSRS
jgi:phosphoenolpyruvate carboxylase